MPQMTQYRSLRRRFLQPITWLLLTNKPQEKYHHTNWQFFIDNEYHLVQLLSTTEINNLGSSCLQASQKTIKQKRKQKTPTTFMISLEKTATGNKDLFRFSTSATSSSVENCPLTTKMSCLMASSPQSTSSRPPTTTGSRDGFTYTMDIHSQIYTVSGKKEATVLSAWI